MKLFLFTVYNYKCLINNEEDYIITLVTKKDSNGKTMVNTKTCFVVNKPAVIKQADKRGIFIVALDE